MGVVLCQKVPNCTGNPYRNGDPNCIALAYIFGKVNPNLSQTPKFNLEYYTSSLSLIWTIIYMSTITGVVVTSTTRKRVPV